MLHTLEFRSHRSPVYARGGMVASSQPLATAAGLEILRRGGNAADAAVATAAGLNVTEPCNTGLGGDMFALYYEAFTGKVYALNGSGRAPAALSLEKIEREGLAEGLPNFHPYTITVPGACAGWCDLHKRFGRLSLDEVFAPAIQMAEEGFPVAPLTSQGWEGGAKNQLAVAPNGEELMIDGRAPHTGEIFRNPNLARALRLIAEQGKDAYYRGPIGAAVAEVVQQAGGCLTVEDLAAHESTWEEPISTTFQGVCIWECPPNGQGLTALIALNILEGFDLASLPPLSVERLHLEIEAMRLAFADTRWFVADPATNPAPLAELLSKEYAAERRKLLNPRRATLDFTHGAPVAGSDTVYFSVADRYGNACSFINSNYMGFGTGYVPKGWGFTLQNRGHNFSLQRGHPNCIAPRKRPYHTIIPAMATRITDGSLYASFGVMGGFMQPQGHTQVALNLLVDGADAQAALDQLRFCIMSGEAGGKVALEDGIPAAVIADLAEMGHPVQRLSGMARRTFGTGQVILRDPATGVLCAGSDPRSDGLAMGLI